MASGWRNAMAAIGVLVGLGALVAIPAVVDAALPTEGPVPAGERLEIGYGVTMTPPRSATLDLGVSRPGTGEILLLVPGFRLSVTAVEVRERPADFTAHARHKLSRDDGLRVGPPTPVRTASGASGQRSDLAVEDSVLGGRPGCVGIFTGESAGVVATITPVADCAAAPSALWDAVLTLTFEPAEQW